MGGLYNLQTFFGVCNFIVNTSKQVLFLPLSDAYVRIFLYLHYTLIKLYYTKALSDQASSLAPDWILLLRGPRIPVYARNSTTTFHVYIRKWWWWQYVGSGGREKDIFERYLVESTRLGFWLDVGGEIDVYKWETERQTETVREARTKWRLRKENNTFDFSGLASSWSQPFQKLPCEALLHCVLLYHSKNLHVISFQEYLLWL